MHELIVGHNYGTWQIKQVLKPAKSTDDPSRKIKRKFVHYWLDTNIEPDLTIEDISKPEYAIKRIKSKVWWKTVGINKSDEPIRQEYDVRKILKAAVELEMRYQYATDKQRVLEVLPKNEGDAVDIFRIESAMRRLKESGNELYLAGKDEFETIRKNYEQRHSS